MNQVSVGVIFLIVAQGFHLYEEVRHDFRRKLPVGEMSKAVFVAANVFVFALAIVTLSLCQQEIGIGFVLAWIFGMGMVMNGCLHIAIMIYRRGYFPGGVTAPLVLVAALYLIYQLAYW